MNQTRLTTATRDASWFERAAHGYLRFVSNLASAAVGGAAAILLGVVPLPGNFPALTFLHSYPYYSVALGVALLILLALAVTLTRRGRPLRGSNGEGPTRFVQFVISPILSAVGSGLIAILLGFGDLPKSVPLLELSKKQPSLGVGLSAAFLALMIISPLFGPGGSPPGGDDRRTRNRLLASTGVATLSSLLFISLLALVVVRPTWCPNGICPAPEARTDPAGVHDQFLELVPTAVQSGTFAL